MRSSGFRLAHSQRSCQLLSRTFLRVATLTLRLNASISAQARRISSHASERCPASTIDSIGSVKIFCFPACAAIDSMAFQPPVAHPFSHFRLQPHRAQDDRDIGDICANRSNTDSTRDSRACLYASRRSPSGNSGWCAAQGVEQRLVVHFLPALSASWKRRAALLSDLLSQCP